LPVGAEGAAVPVDDVDGVVVPVRPRGDVEAEVPHHLLDVRGRSFLDGWRPPPASRRLMGWEWLLPSKRLSAPARKQPQESSKTVAGLTPRGWGFD